MYCFLLFSPLRRLPLGSLDSAVRGFPFFSGFLAIKVKNATFDAFQRKKTRVPLTRHVFSELKVAGPDGGSMLVLGRL